MSLTNLKKSLANIKNRRSSAFIFEHSDKSNPTRANATPRNLGEIRDASLTWEPISTSRSSTGRRIQKGAAVEVTFVMMQTSDTEIAALPLIARENDFGSTFKFTMKPSQDGQKAEGFIFENAGVEIGSEVSLGGEESGLSVTIMGECDMDSLANLGKPKAGDGLGGADADGYYEGERVLTFDF